VLAENFDAIEWDHHGAELNFLPVDVFLDILNNRALTLDTEYRVYKVIANFTAGAIVFCGDLHEPRLEKVAKDCVDARRRAGTDDGRRLL
jgi:hypothetical protein